MIAAIDGRARPAAHGGRDLRPRRVVPGRAPRVTPAELVAEATLDPAPLLILLGTGWGLADALIPSVSRVLAPIDGALGLESSVGPLGRRGPPRSPVRLARLDGQGVILP